MTVKLGVTTEGKFKMTMGPERVRLDSLEKFLGRNHDAILVKLTGPHDTSMNYKPGHVCRIEEDDEDKQKFNVFVGKHFIGQLPEEAINFADLVGSFPAFLVSMVGKVENDEIYIYVAE